MPTDDEENQKEIKEYIGVRLCAMLHIVHDDLTLAHEQLHEGTLAAAAGFMEAFIAKAQTVLETMKEAIEAVEEREIQVTIPPEETRH